MFVRLLPALLLTLVPACGDGEAALTDPLPAADTTLLFVGNSLTYTHDLPGAVTTVARALGHDVVGVGVASPNFALEDHWHRGIAERIRELGPDVVILQQGPSSLPQNQDHLAAWTDSLARVAREVGARPALLMVWPSKSRDHAFDAVRDAYHRAAEGVDGDFIPAGEAIRVLPRDGGSLDPRAGDGFHPSATGTALVAYVTVGALFGDTVSGLSATLPAAAAGGAPVIVPEAAAPRIQAVADSVAAAWR